MLDPPIQGSEDDQQNCDFAERFAHHFKDGLARALHAEGISQHVWSHNLDVIIRYGNRPPRKLTEGSSNSSVLLRMLKPFAMRDLELFFAIHHLNENR